MCVSYGFLRHFGFLAFWECNFCFCLIGGGLLINIRFKLMSLVEVFGFLSFLMLWWDHSAFMKMNSM